MSAQTKTKRQWTSRFAFLMASIGAAVGLGNLWRFPFQAGENGGSAFVLVYLLCIALLAFPVLTAELAIGRRGGLSAVGSTARLARDAGRPALWGVVGLLGVVATYSVLTIYGVIAGKVLAYAVSSFAGLVWADAQSIHAGPLQAFFWQSVFMGLTIAIVARGLRDGIERFSVILMPLFFVMLVGLSVYALASGAAVETVRYLFAPRFSEITPPVVLAAMGQAFFSVAVGGAAMLTYGAFLSPDEDLASNGALIVGADTLVALVAGLMIFPIVFRFDLDPAAGMGLIFNAMPEAFAAMPFGGLIGGAFFFLAFVAALSSSIAMLMIAVVVGEEQFGLTRRDATLGLGALAWAIGAASIFWPALSEMIDFAAGQVMMPIGAFLVSVFAGWIAAPDAMRGELAGVNGAMFGLWRAIIRFAAPLAIAAILVLGLTTGH